MRITNTSMIKNYMYDTQQNLSRLNNINKQINSGKVINKVSDDPHKAVRIMSLNSEIKYNEKYNYNIDETVGWMNTTDGSLDNLNTVLGDIKEDILSIIKFSEISRREGLLSLEEYIDDYTGDNFMQKGLMLIIDGMNEEHLRELLEGSIQPLF